ncbi:uncharacterized protein VNE69_04070 [Vairimorpha necatrix]|uniref:Uncharacterized protein n=1 Tax=Vairimorpha necatrix TaxID=6039 RepID=A0AAX4JBI4_9MICR
MFVKIIFFILRITANEENMIFSFRNGDYNDIFIGLNSNIPTSGYYFFKIFVSCTYSNLLCEDKTSIDSPFDTYDFIKCKYDDELKTFLDKAFSHDNIDKMNFIRCKMFLKAKIKLQSFRTYFITSVFSLYGKNINQVCNSKVNYLDNNTSLNYIKLYLNNTNYDELKKIVPENTELFVVEQIRKHKCLIQDYIQSRRVDLTSLSNDFNQNNNVKFCVIDNNKNVEKNYSSTNFNIIDEKGIVLDVGEDKQFIDKDYISTDTNGIKHKFIEMNTENENNMCNTNKKRTLHVTFGEDEVVTLKTPSKQKFCSKFCKTTKQKIVCVSVLYLISLIIFLYYLFK